MNRDTVVGIVGAVVLVAAMVGIFWYEGTRGVGGAERFTVTEWAEASVNGPQVSGTTQEGAASEETLVVDRLNLKAVDVCLVWTDDIGAPDSFELAVEPPPGLGDPKGATGDAGELCVSFTDLNPAPTATTVAADDEDQAKERLAEQSGNTRGVGSYNATVTLTQAGDETTPLPNAPPVREDTGNAWQLKVIYHLHEPRFEGR